MRTCRTAVSGQSVQPAALQSLTASCPVDLSHRSRSLICTVKVTNTSSSQCTNVKVTNMPGVKTVKSYHKYSYSMHATLQTHPDCGSSYKHNISRFPGQDISQTHVPNLIQVTTCYKHIQTKGKIQTHPALLQVKARHKQGLFQLALITIVCRVV